MSSIVDLKVRRSSNAFLGGDQFSHASQLDAFIGGGTRQYRQRSVGVRRLPAVSVNQSLFMVASWATRPPNLP